MPRDAPSGDSRSRDPVRRCIAPGCREATEGDRLYCDHHHSCTLEGDERRTWAGERETGPDPSRRGSESELGVRTSLLGE